MKPNLTDFPDSEDEKYMYTDSDWLREFDSDAFLQDALKWKRDFEAALRERLKDDYIPMISIKEVLGE
jgi:hypothetical protein